ncbi:MAG: WbqC family protein [Fulvivirga sp.]|nr:WbqC family protein [Fulvivirga sp.]
MRVAISQSNYIPWKGYFDSIAKVDAFVLYDDMQYTKRDWRNRNYIKTEQGLKWLSIPVQVKGKFHQKINETYVSDENWNIKHWDRLKQVYKEAPFFDEMSEWLEPLYLQCNYSNLSEINRYFLSEIMLFLGIKTKLLDSHQFKIEGDKTEKLISICKQLNADTYYTGPAAKDYIDENLFRQQNINLNYFDYKGYPEYNQLYGEFEHGVSIIDMLFNLGENTSNYMKNVNK